MDNSGEKASKNRAMAAGNKRVFRRADIGGSSMAQHWEKILRYEKDSHDKKATYGTKSLQEMLQAEKFDLVTIQQYSMISHDVATYLSHAGRAIASLCQSARTRN